MTDDVPRLVLRRTNNAINDKVAIRLAKDVDRTKDLYDLFQQGVVIEVTDIEKSHTGDHHFVTLSFNAPAEFAIDRVEKILYPRSGFAIAEEYAVKYPVLTLAEAEALSLDEVEVELAEAERAISELEAQLKRLRRDRSKAADRGYARPASERHHEWIMIIEEADMLHEQIRGARVTKNQLTEVRKRKRTLAHNARCESFQAHFLTLAKERLSAKEFESLEADAKELSNPARTAA